jgi:hypothetical protein
MTVLSYYDIVIFNLNGFDIFIDGHHGPRDAGSYAEIVAIE